MLQYTFSRLFPPLAEVVADVFPAGSVLRMAEHALQGVKAGLDPVSVEIAGGMFKALGCRGMLRLQDQERTIGICIEALRIPGAAPAPTIALVFIKFLEIPPPSCSH
jgi:hypothetical protein